MVKNFSKEDKRDLEDEVRNFEIDDIKLPDAYFVSNEDLQ